MVKKWLDGKNVKYEIVDLDNNPEMQQMIYKKSGALTVPVTLIEDEDGMESVVVGFNLPKLTSSVL